MTNLAAKTTWYNKTTWPSPAGGLNRQVPLYIQIHMIHHFDTFFYFLINEHILNVSQV